MNSKSVNKKYLYIQDALVFIFCIALDRVTKYFAMGRLKDRASFSVIDGILELHYVENTGAAFGLLKDQTSFFIFITCIVLLTGLYFIVRSPGKKKYIISHVFISLIAGGAVGNACDRVLYKAVVDFIYISYIDFPIFNVADILVTVSTVGLVIVMIFVYKEDDLNFLKFKEKKLREI